MPSVSSTSALVAPQCAAGVGAGEVLRAEAARIEQGDGEGIAQRQRDQFLGLFVQSPIFRCRASQGVETLRHLGQIGPKCGKVFGNALRMAARNVAALLRGLANEDRLLLLCQMTGGELSVGDLEVRVTTLRDGKRIFYSIDDAKVLDLLATLYRLYCPENGVM